MAKTKKSNIRPIPSKALGCFVYKGNNLKVLIDNQEEMDTISEYLDFNLEEYLGDYMGPMWSPGSPIIARLGNDGVSISGEGQRNILGQSWDLSNAMPIKAFMNPEKYPQYFI